MPVSAWIVSNWGWRVTFYVLAALSFIPMFLLWQYVTDTPRQNKRINKAELDYIEDALKSESAGEEVKTERLSQRLASFCCNYRFWVVVVHYMSFTCIWWGMMTWMPSYLKTARGFSWSAMGMLSSLPYVISLITLWCFSHIADKIGRRAQFVAVGFLVSAICIYSGAYVRDNMTSAILLSIGIGGNRNYTFNSTLDFAIHCPKKVGRYYNGHDERYS